MANYKVPSQAASGADTFSDFLVGLQFTDGVSQMTNGTFAIDDTIPERDAKEFITEPFSQFITLDDISQEVNTQNILYDGGTTNEPAIKFNNNKNNADRSYFGSIKQRIGVSISDIIQKYPAAVMVDVTSPMGLNNNSAESITYDALTNSTSFQIQYSLFYNPLDVILISPDTSVLTPDTDLRNFYSSYTKYVIDLSGATYSILTYTEPNSENKISLKVEGNPFGGISAYTMNYLIRPNNGVVEEFYKGLDDVQSVLINRETLPMFNAGFNVPRDTNNGYNTETITEYVNWPVSRDGWNIQIVGLNYDYYIQKITSLSDEIDEYRTNLIVRFLTSPQLYEFDTEEKKIEAIFQIYGQSFDQVKTFIDNIAYMRNVSYDGINNVPDILLKNLSETLGLSTVSLFDEKSLQDSLYTRHDVRYDGVSLGTNLIEAETEFYRRLLVNLAILYKSKGTRKALEFFLKFIGAPEPIIRIDEYVYKVDGGLPSKTIEDDIWAAIRGTKVVNTVEYVTTTGFTGYTLTQVSGSTTLSRDEYPVDEGTGLPRKVVSTDGSMFFQKGAGWYKKTLSHRSPDILDEVNSNLTGRTKTIKTMSKPFTYGEDYFDVYRNLPGLDYGYELTSDINNIKIQVIDDEMSSHLVLNRKNINIFLSADRAIDYDIYRQSRDLELSFGNLMPQTGKTFAEFLDDAISEIITNSHVVRYKNIYTDLLGVYNLYLQSNSFTPYTYISVNDFINRLSPYWVNIIEQFIPATTLWTGGNVIENGSFNRSKFKHKQPSLPISYVELLCPDFQTVIYEDLESIIGGGELFGGEQNFRGVHLFSGVTFDIYLNINGNSYTATTNFFKPFSGHTVDTYYDCTTLVSSTEYIPLMRGFQLFTGGDSITAIKSGWTATLDTLVSSINLANNSPTGFTLNAQYYTDTDGVDKVRFTILYHDYYGRTDNESFEYYFLPVYSTQQMNCTMSVAVSGATYWVFTINNPQGIVTAIDPNGPIEAYSGSTYSTITHVTLSKESPYGGICTYQAPLPGPSDNTILMFNDGGNCQVGYTFVGTSGTTTQVFNRGIKQGTIVYKITGTTTPDGCQQINVENVQIGDNLLCPILKSCNQINVGQFNKGDYRSAFTYTGATVESIGWLSSSKTNIINDKFRVLPTSKILVYSNINLLLEETIYGFTYKYPEDIYVRPSDGSRNGDFLISENGAAIEVTGLTLDYGAYDVYYHLGMTEVSLGNNVTIFNGVAGPDTGIAVQFTETTIIPTPSVTPSITTTPTRTPSITPTQSITPTVTPTTSITPSVTGTPGASPTPSPSLTPTVTPTSTVTPTVTPTPSVTPTSTVTPSITPTRTQTPTVTPTRTPTRTPTPTVTPTITPSETPGIDPSVTPTRTPSPTSTPSISISPSPTRTPAASPQ